jgi:hypothetical protein
MFRSRGSLVFVGALALLAVSYPRMARADLVILQESNGFPGAQEGDSARQKVMIAEDRMKVLDQAHGWALYVRLDNKKVDEAWALERGYIEKPLSFYAHIRDDREKKRAEHLAEYKKQIERAKDDSERRMLKQELEKMGLREDGTTKARIEPFPDEKKKVTLIVDNKQQEVELEHYKVRENEGEHEIFDVWVAPSIPRPVSIFTFYKEIGTFSDPVVAEVMKLPGFPVEIAARVDDGNNAKVLHSKVHEIRNEGVAAVEYDLPAGWAPIPEKPTGPQPAAKQVPCAICGKLCTPGEGGASTFISPFTREAFPVCSDEHRAQIIHKLAPKSQDKSK